MSALAYAEPDLFKAEASPKPLRPHQVTAMTMLRQSLAKGKRRVVLQLPTGAGKTRTAAEVINGALAKGNRVAFTVPAISLIEQTIDAFSDEGIDCVGVMQASHRMTNHLQPVQIVSVQSMARRYYPDVDVVVVDECHQQFETVRKWMKAEPSKVFIGLSATPWARGMADDWEELVSPVSMQGLIDQKFLSPFRVFAPNHPDLSGVKIVAGDYHEGQLGEVMGGLVADVVTTWKQRAQGLPTLVFAVNRAHAGKLVDQFREAGIRMGYCDAYTDMIERQSLFAAMARGELAGIVNVGTLTTGVDADVRCVVLARPTRSEMLFVQMIGRGLRTAPGKSHAVILDHADNHARLGFVTDIHHAALLDGKAPREKTRKEKGEPMPKECGSCGTLKPPKVAECPACGFKPERQSEIEVEAGELVEVTGKKQYTKEEKQAWWSGLLWIASERGRQRGWASHTYRDRFGVWPRGLDDRPAPPSQDVTRFVTAKAIRYAKRREAA